MFLICKMVSAYSLVRILFYRLITICKQQQLLFSPCICYILDYMKHVEDTILRHITNKVLKRESETLVEPQYFPLAIQPTRSHELFPLVLVYFEIDFFSTDSLHLIDLLDCTNPWKQKRMGTNNSAQKSVTQESVTHRHQPQSLCVCTTILYELTQLVLAFRSGGSGVKSIKLFLILKSMDGLMGLSWCCRLSQLESRSILVILLVWTQLFFTSHTALC